MHCPPCYFLEITQASLALYSIVLVSYRLECGVKLAGLAVEVIHPELPQPGLGAAHGGGVRGGGRRGEEGRVRAGAHQQTRAVVSAGQAGTGRNSLDVGRLVGWVERVYQSVRVGWVPGAG